MSNILIMVLSTVAFFVATLIILSYRKMILEVKNCAKNGQLKQGICNEIRETSGSNINSSRNHSWVFSYDIGDGITLKDAHYVSMWHFKSDMFIKPEKKPEIGDIRKFWVNKVSDKIRKNTFWTLPGIQDDLVYWEYEDEINNAGELLIKIMNVVTCIFGLATLAMIIACVKMIIGS